MADNVTLIGGGFVGEGADAAHANAVLGCRNGPFGVAWATALATPRPGNAAFVTVVRPGAPARDHPVDPFFDPAIAASAGP